MTARPGEGGSNADDDADDASVLEVKGDVL
jgi:hypothetical protein